MERDVRYFFVGLCAILCLGALAGFLSWLAGTHDARSYRNYTVYFTEAVTGLTAGNEVRYKGVEAGTVMAIRLAENRPDLVKVDIQVSETTPIRKNTVAALSMAGITGSTYIDLETQPGDVGKARSVEEEQHPVITGKGMQFARIMQDVPDISRNILEITEKLNGLLDSNAFAEMEKIPERINGLAAHIEQIISGDNANKIASILKNTESLTKDLNGLLSVKNLEYASVTLENAAAASSELHKMTGTLEDAAAEIANAARNLTGVIARNEENLNRLSTDGLNQIIRLSEESRQTANAIKRLADSLEDDPSQLLYQPKYHGVKTPK